MNEQQTDTVKEFHIYGHDDRPELEAVEVNDTIEQHKLGVDFMKAKIADCACGHSAARHGSDGNCVWCGCKAFVPPASEQEPDNYILEIYNPGEGFRFRAVCMLCGDTSELVNAKLLAQQWLHFHEKDWHNRVASCVHPPGSGICGRCLHKEEHLLELEKTEYPLNVDGWFAVYNSHDEPAALFMSKAVAASFIDKLGIESEKWKIRDVKKVK